MSWRAIKDSAPYSESLSAVSAGAERLYWRMLSVTDPWGRLEGSPRKVRAKCLPLVKATDRQVARWLVELVEVDRILIFESDGKPYAQITAFDENQYGEFIRRRGASQFPEPPANRQESWLFPELAGPVRISPADNDNDRDKDKTTTKTKRTTTLALEKRARRTDVLWDALVEELGDVQTETERGRRNKALAELRAVEATPETVHQKCDAYRRRYPTVDLTATALAANWSQLDRPLPRGTKLTAADTMAIARGERTL